MSDRVRDVRGTDAPLDVLPTWLTSGVPLTLLMDLACMRDDGYPEALGRALAQEQNRRGGPR